MLYGVGWGGGMHDQIFMLHKWWKLHTQIRI